MEEKLENITSAKKIDECEKIVDNLSPTTIITEEEHQNFMNVVTQVEKIVKKLASSDPQEQEHGKILADQMLQSRAQKEISEDDELIVKTNKTVINKYASSEETDPSKMSQEMFMKSIEKDAKQRAEDRKVRNERAETFRLIGNGAFRNGDYEKAVTYYTKAIEQRKDSSVLWNNRGLSYMRLKLYEKALLDFEWALKVNDTSLKALLNSALCYKHLRNEQKWNEYIQTAKDRNPYYHKFINDFEKNMEATSDTCVE